ncbi:MAG: aldo/keto reductase [Planctomycetes bacterium]|nr:aldo/keto reductase [Planctomycetota bacterium]
METAILGRTGLEVKRLGFGGIKLPRVESPELAAQIVERAIDLGVNFIDTARGYGPSEERIGMVMKKRRDEVVLASKVIRRTREEAEEDIETSLRNLQTDRIDLYQVHDLSLWENYEKATGPGGALEAVQAARDAGKVRYIGVSGHELDILVEAINSGVFDTVQVAYNLANRGAAEKVIPLAKEKDMGVINMKPFAGGMMLAEVKRTDEDADLPQITAEAGLRFCLSQPDITVVIPGMQKLEEVDENLAIAEAFRPLSDEEAEQYMKAAASLGEGFCRGCEYCQPCPEEIQVHEIMQTIGHVKRFQGDWDIFHRMKQKYQSLEKTIADCADCGECEEKCPFHLPIRETMKEAEERLGAKK